MATEVGFREERTSHICVMLEHPREAAGETVCAMGAGSGARLAGWVSGHLITVWPSYFSPL